jgi:thiol-disulfide isomerase/thioredoxin
VAKLSVGSNKVLGSGYTKKSLWGDVIIGAALGPVFSTCSPTYFVILATVLPASLLLGTLYLLSYVLGLSLVLLFIALIGERFSGSLLKYADGRGAFKRIIGGLFILLGILIITGYEKKLETKLLDQGYFDVTKIEHLLLEKVEQEEIFESKTMQVEVQSTEIKTEVPETQTQTSELLGTPTQEVPTTIKKDSVLPVVVPLPSVKKPVAEEASLKRYVEFVNPSGFVNTSGKEIAMSDYVGRDIILVEVMTYSCINCQRTFPFMNSWYEKYKDKGLTVIGLHTPEFSYEKKKQNVEDAMKQFGIEFPVVLDNNYETWNAYGNRFWPRRYLIDFEGNIVFDHIGEGKYKETEEKILELLAERKRILGVE